jgi:hypothetical protein
MPLDLKKTYIYRKEILNILFFIILFRIEKNALKNKIHNTFLMKFIQSYIHTKVTNKSAKLKQNKIYAS